MAKTYLSQMVEDASRLDHALADDDALPAWVDYYIATSADRLQTASRYMQSEIKRFQPARPAQVAKANTLALARPNKGVVSSPVPGVILKHSGVKLNEKMIAFLKELRPLLDFDLTVTSGIRTVEQQADAVWAKLSNPKMGYDHVDKLYAMDVSPLKNAKSKADVVKFVQDAANRGKLMSDHMKGEALDFRDRDLTKDQKDKLAKAIASLGIELHAEPDHYHVEGVGGLRIQAKKAVEKAISLLPWFVGGAVLIAGAGAGTYIYMKRVRR